MTDSGLMIGDYEDMVWGQSASAVPSPCKLLDPIILNEETLHLSLDFDHSFESLR